ncbi:hypothetical protein IC006_0367 [Sulfuracidifex tepidarius]|uniref:Uncharacterized protein n=1 Tax=Sulfuracidifex tepidarius TaxID=1294262 RepID=A0A510DSD4_9CREN|nr:hypothetical protein [Sulfuracidifex tepidarius]BBG23083.1 hypothetical protein IC006_0367 [Sulfuracidifex tepidarius]
MAISQDRLERMDRAFKVIFLIAFLLQIALAAWVTNDSATAPLTGAQVATVGLITVMLLVIAAAVYSQFPESRLGKPK